MKKILLLCFVFLVFQNCGYSPIYGKNKKINFYIKSINFEGDTHLSNNIKTNLNNYRSNNDGTVFIINAKIDYQKNISSNDVRGEAEEYDLVAFVRFNINYAGGSKTLQISESFKMDNFSDEFEEREYENIIKQSMARSIVSKLVVQLTRIDVSKI